jgi:hypothetical protein
MAETITSIIVPAVSALVGGAIGSLGAPWIHWNIEKRKLRLAARRELIASWRTAVGWQSWEAGSKAFRETEAYASLRLHLSPEMKKKIEDDTVHVVLGGRNAGANNFAPVLLDEIARIEREWGLL